MNTNCPQCKTNILNHHHSKFNDFFVTFYFICPNCGMEFDEEVEKIKIGVLDGKI